MIKNKSLLIGGSKLRENALKIIEAGIKSADPKVAIKYHVRLSGERLLVGERSYDLKIHKNIYVVGAGKAAAAMACALEEVLGDRIRAGAVNVKHRERGTKVIKLNKGGHPIPDESTLNSTKEIIKILGMARKGDLVFVLLSGGGSAMMELPSPEVNLEDLKRVNELLLRCGAEIGEINAVRKHLSSVKGGKLVKATQAQLIALILSDVVGDRLGVIASGPTAPDPTTFSEALAILRRYGLLDKVPKSVLTYLKKGAAGLIPETPKPSDVAFKRVYNLIVGSGERAVRFASAMAKKLGYEEAVVFPAVIGESREVGREHASILRKAARDKKSTALISGGETTVTIRGDGRGGPNQEFVLSAALALKGAKNFVVAAIDTDGEDGPTDAAGALADALTLTQAKKMGLDGQEELKRNNSYHFFKKVGGLIHTGPTGTNVNDLRVLLTAS